MKKVMFGCLAAFAIAQNSFADLTIVPKADDGEVTVAKILPLKKTDASGSELKEAYIERKTPQSNFNALNTLPQGMEVATRPAPVPTQPQPSVPKPLPVEGIAATTPAPVANPLPVPAVNQTAVAKPNSNSNNVASTPAIISQRQDIRTVDVAVQKNTQSDNPVDVGSSGRDMEVGVLLESMYSVKGQWKINYERGLTSKTKVSWATQSSKVSDVIAAIAMQSGLYIAENKEHQVIGVSRSKELAPFLAQSPVQVWYVEKDTMRKVVAEWAEQAGLAGVDWQPKRDHHIEHGAILTGTIDEALHELLLSVLHSDLPLKAEITQNGIIEIKEGGWEAVR